MFDVDLFVIVTYFNKCVLKLYWAYFILAPLRRPHIPIEDIMKGKISPDQTNEKTNTVFYSIEYLARLAMSPLCLVLPNDWERISNDYPMLVRKVRGNL